MRDILIVDGYNVLNAWPELTASMQLNLEAAREDLIAQMQDYAGFSGARVIIVFDAYHRADAAAEEERLGVKVVYTGRNDTADHYIERLVESLRAQRKTSVRVATSDRLEQSIILGLGAVRVSARELRDEVMRHKKSLRVQFTGRNEVKEHMLEDRLPERVLSGLKSIRKELGFGRAKERRGGEDKG